MKAKVYVTLKPSVLDPQGKAIQHSVEQLGYQQIADIRQGKYFEIALDDCDSVFLSVDIDVCDPGGVRWKIREAFSTLRKRLRFDTKSGGTPTGSLLAALGIIRSNNQPVNSGRRIRKKRRHGGTFSKLAGSLSQHGPQAKDFFDHFPHQRRQADGCRNIV